LAVDFSIIKEHQWRVFKARMNELYARDAVKCRTQYGDESHLDKKVEARRRSVGSFVPVHVYLICFIFRTSILGPYTFG
jgi:hypothetical protein